MKTKNALLISIVLIGLTALSCQKQTDYQPQIDALQSSVNALIQRCDSLANALAQSNKTILSLSTDILDLTTKQGNTNSAIDSIKTQIAGILTSVTSLNDQLSKAYNKIDSLNTQLAQTNVNITAIHAQLALLGTQITQLTTQYTSLLARLNQIQFFLNLTNSLVVYYPFTGNANDSSGNGNNGTVYGANLTTDRFGNPNSAYSFDGVGNYISSANINLSVSATISIWVYPIGPIGALVDKDKDAISDAGYTLIYNNPLHGLYAHVGWSGDSTNNVLPSPIDSLTISHWHHCLLTYSNGTANLFLDGSLIYTRAGLNPITQNNDQLLFGKSVWGGNVFQGKLDEIRLWKRVITNEEIQYLYTH